MALITIPSSPQKGIEQQYELNTTELFALVSDSYFTDQNNLRVIEVIYQSSISNQIELISFIPNGSATLTNMAEFASQSRDSFSIQNIVLVDKQNGRYVVQSSVIPNVATYDIVFPPPGDGIIWDLSPGNYTPGVDGALTKISNNLVSILATANTVNNPNALDYYELEFQFEGLPTTGSLYGVDLGGEIVALQGDDTNNPRINLLGSANFTISQYGLPTLLPGLNSWKIIVDSGLVRFGINGTVVSWGSIGWSSITPLARLVNSGEEIISTQEVITPGQSSTFSPSLLAPTISLSNNNLTAQRTTSDGNPYNSVFTENPYMLSGTEKLYFELTVNNSSNSGFQAFGFILQNTTPSVFVDYGYALPGSIALTGPKVYHQAGILIKQAQGTSGQVINSSVGTISTNDIVGVAVDIGAKTFRFFRNGNWTTDYSFSDILSTADRLYFGASLYGFSDPFQDIFTKNITSANTPAGYTLI